MSGSFPSPQQLLTSDSITSFGRALAFMGQGKFEEALKGLNSYLEKEENPKSKLGIHLLVAKINKQMKNPTTAAVHVNAALKIDSANEEALKLYVQLKGRAGELFAEATELLLKNQPMQAIDSLKHAIELDDKDTRFLVRRGVIYRQMGLYNEAVADLEKVIEITNGNNSDASRQLAIAYNQLGIELYSAREYQQALDVFQLAIKHDDKSPSIFINKGDCHREMHQVGQALQNYLHAHELNPEDTEIRIRLSTLYDARGLTFFDRGMLDEAFREFSKAIEYLPQVSHYYIHRATAAIELGMLDDALRDYRAVVKMDPYNEQAWAKLSSMGDSKGGRFDADEGPGLTAPRQGMTRGRTGVGRSKSRERTGLGTRGQTLGTATGTRGRTKGRLDASNASTESVGRGERATRPVTRIPMKSRSPTRTSKDESDFLTSLAKQKEFGLNAFRDQLGEVFPSSSPSVSQSLSLVLASFNILLLVLRMVGAKTS